MKHTDKLLFILSLILCFFAGAQANEFSGQMLLNEYEAGIEQLNRDKASLEDFIMIREGGKSWYMI